MSIGLHISKQSAIRNEVFKNMEDAVIDTVELFGLSSCQIFTHGPRNYAQNKMNYSKIKNYCAEKNIYISTHGSYVSTGIWKVTKENKETSYSQKQIKHIAGMIYSVKQIGGAGMVLHLPNKAKEVIFETLEVLSGIKEINESGVYIILEMPASKPSATTYETADKLNELCALINNEKITLQWCLCIDTAHQYSCGVSFSDLQVWRTWLSNLTEFVRNKIKLIHLNGISSKHFNTGKDVHEIIMAPTDGIWHHLMTPETLGFLNLNAEELVRNKSDLSIDISEDEFRKIQESSLGDIVEFSKKNDCALVMEVNAGEFIYAKFAIDIIKKLLK
jgi:endonuclease IV